MDEVTVAEYGNPAEAAMWADVLEQAGIPSRPVSVGAEIAAVGPGAWVACELRVLARDAERARDILGVLP